jgi:hypothetical protein
MENSRGCAALNKNFGGSITRGVLFEKTTPLDPLQKLLIMYSKIFNEKFLRGAGAVFSKSLFMSSGAAQFYRRKHLKVLPLTIDH